MSRWSSMFAEAVREVIPLEVLIEVTHTCNFRCQHCFIPDFSVKDGMSTERLLHLLDELVEMGTFRVTLSGGEIFLRRDWLEIAEGVRERGLLLNLYTNGFLIDEMIADQLAALHSQVEISFYSADEAVFDDVTRRPGSFRKVCQGIELLRARGLSVRLKVPLMKSTRSGLGDIANYATSVGAEWLIFDKIVAKKDGDKSPIALRLDKSELKDFYGGPYGGCRLPEEESVSDAPLCAAATRFCTITYNGDVLACNILPGVGGNINESSFREIWEESEWLNQVRSIRASDLHTCGTCQKLSYCGRCHAQALVEDGDLHGPSTWAKERAEQIERLADEGRIPS